MQSLMKINGAWKEGTPYLKEGGTWKEIGAVTAKANGKWADIAPPKPVSPVFGVRIAINNESPNDAVEYIDDATGFTPMTRNSPGSWANHPLISGIKPVLHKPDGTWQDLNKRDLQTGIADLANAGDILTRFPTWWLSITEDTEYQYIRFCQEKLDDTYYKLASYFKGKDQGMFHMGCYPSDGSGSKYHLGLSKDSAIGPAIDKSHAIGEGFDTLSYRHLQYLLALFVVLFKGRDARSLLGHGYSGRRPTADWGSVFDNDYGMKGSASIDDHVSFFWVSDFWGGARTWIGNLMINKGRVSVQDSGELIKFGIGEYVGTCIGVDGPVDKMDMSSTKMAFIPKSAGSGPSRNWCTKSRIASTDLFYGSFGGSKYDDFGEDIMSPFSLDIALFYNPTGGTRPGDTSARIVYRLAVE